MSPRKGTGAKEGPDPAAVRLPPPAPFPVEPWQVREPSLDLDRLAQTESIFALSNGHIGLRGNLDEGEPSGLPGTYLGSFYEERPLPYAEAGFGYPDRGETLVNVTNGKIIRLLLDDEPVDLRYGRLHSHERVLDLQSGLLHRTFEWSSPAGRRVRVTSTRMVSFQQRAVAAIDYRVEVLNGSSRIIVQSELVANEEVPAASGDPRVAAALDRPLEAIEQHVREHSAVLLHRTKTSGLRMAAGMEHLLEAPDRFHQRTEHEDDWARTTIGGVLEQGEVLRLTKFLAYGWSSARSVPALRDQVSAALAGAVFTGWDGLVAEQRDFLDDFWDGADVLVEGDAEIQQAARFGLFQVLSAGARAEQRAIPAKGLTGPGYDGHCFWDTEMFSLPVLTYTMPGAVADALQWRHSTLAESRDRARTLGLEGAAFAWRTISGKECSGYWPAGTAAFHLNADIADAVLRYWHATDDHAFMAAYGTEVLVETARMWRSLGAHDRDGSFHVDGVTGPDEYSAIADDNVFTNLMAQRNLLGAAQACQRFSDTADLLKVSKEERASWRDAAGAMTVPYDEALQVHSQAQRFTEHAEWDWDATTQEDYPLLLHAPYYDLYRKQVVKQADLILAMHWRGDAFTPEEKARAVAYYEPRTVRDSSLSACTQGVLCAEVGHLELAHDYLLEAAHIDLRDLAHNTRDGLHVASLAGVWHGLVAGFGGFRDHDGVWSFAPRLPSQVTRLAFNLRIRTTRLRVDVQPEQVTFALDDGRATLDLVCHGEPVRLTTKEPVTVAIPPLGDVGPEPAQPPGRTPARRQL